jgi:hypothetical protein
MILDSCHESRLMKSNFHKKQFYKYTYLWFFIKTLKITAYFVFLWNMSLDSYNFFIELVFMSHESRLMKKVYRICFYESSLIMSVDSWKNTHEIFIELTPEVNFTNILCTAFMRTDPKSTNKTHGLTIMFVLLWSVHIKAWVKCWWNRPQELRLRIGPLAKLIVTL